MREHLYTRDDVALHSKKGDIWVTIRNKVYDVSKFADYHPGGINTLLAVGGRDATLEFVNFHPETIVNQLCNYEIGSLQDYKKSDLEKEYIILRDSILKEGLFITDMKFYIVEWSRILIIFILALYLSLSTENFTLIGAIFLGIFWQQAAFTGHDTGHNSITHVRINDSKLGLIAGNLLTGISMAWWKKSHNVHHVNPNCIEEDPDIQHLPLLAVTDEILGHGFYSIFHKRWMEADPIALRLISIQHFLFYPIMCLARFNLYVQSFVVVLSQHDKIAYRTAELFTLGAFWIWFLSLVYASCNGSLLMSITYIMVSHSIAGILHVQICLSHFSMLTYSKEKNALDWVRKQCLTTLNIDCNPWLDWFHGGLQFQLEHHLFPRLPRHNLRRISPLVRDLCKRHQINYRSLSWLRAQAELVVHLRDRAKSAVNYF